MKMKIKEKDTEAKEKRKIKGSKYGPLLKDLREFKRNKKGITGFIMLVIAIFLAVFAPVLILHNPLSHYSEDAYVHHPPTREYPLGTDVL
ncbi:MAG: hypothetical protein HXS54_15015, partial [Theionarchaea archaeon]|nr:hypothetical protein [Theionarchaea archaeon]